MYQGRGVSENQSVCTACAWEGLVHNKKKLINLNFEKNYSNILKHGDKWQKSI